MPGRPRRRADARAENRIAAAESDSHQRAVAASVQETRRGWLIFWSPWRRTYTAIASITREPTILDEKLVDVLLEKIARIEQQEWARRGGT